MKRINEGNQKTTEIVKQLKSEIQNLVELNGKREKSIVEIEENMEKISQNLDSNQETKTNNKNSNEKQNSAPQETEEIDYKELIIPKKIIFPQSKKRSRTFIKWLFNNKFN